eukprot:s6325_g1.t1
MTGGLVAWSSHRQAFVTMSTAESELVAICELTTCMRSIEELVAEVMLLDKNKATEVTKAIYTDSQAALAVCKSAAGSWRTRHLRIRGSLVRELLELPDWVANHIDGGKRDYWEIDERQGIAIRHHPTARLNLFVPGQAAGGPPMNQFTGKRRTVGRLSNGEVRVHEDDFSVLSKPAQLFASKEWKGRTELRLKRGG